MNKKTTNILIVLSLLGVGISAWLVSQHFHLLKSGFSEKSFCSFNETFNCDVVNGSSYSEIASIPLAGLGLLYYLFMLIATLTARFTSGEKKSLLTFSFFLSLFSVAFIFYTAYVSFFILHAVCVMCIALYLITLFLFLLTPKAVGTKWGDFFKLCPKSMLKPILFTCILYLVGIGLLYAMNPTNSSKVKKVNVEEMVKKHFEQKPSEINYARHPVWGNAEAPIKIVEFSDFQCPFCKMAAENLRPALAEFKNKVAFYFVNYPLDQSCNQYVNRPMHNAACNAAKAARCMEQEGQFWDYHDALFANQKTLYLDQLINFASARGVGKEKFSECLYSQETLNDIKADIEEGHALEVSGTPAIFVNGRKVAGWTNFKFLRAVIEEELKK